MVLKNHPLSGEDRKIVSTRLYQSEFLMFKKLCGQEGKTINNKLREMIQQEIEKDLKLLSKTLLSKRKEDIEKAKEILKIEQKKYNFEIKGVDKHV